MTEAEASPKKLSPFAHGVASFDPASDGVLLWTRVAAEAGTTLAWHLSRKPDDPPEQHGTVDVQPDDDGCVRVDVAGLEPATTYHYWFALDGVLSPIGRTRTLPVGPTELARVAVVCCADRSMGALSTYRTIANDEVDLVLHLGDYSYEEPKGPYEVDPPGTCVTLADYRRRQAHTRLDADLQALHLRHPMVFMWDDHDIADNAWRHGAKEHDEAEHGDWETRLAAAAKARNEWLPARLPDPDDLLAMWRSFALGDLTELVVLDTRVAGRDEPFGDDGAKPLDSADRSLLDPAQRRWAYERVADRSRPWCLVASAVPVADIELPLPKGEVLNKMLPSGYQVIDGKAVCTDLWTGYPVERDALTAKFAERGGGTVVLSGDVHSSWALPVPGPDGTSVAVEFVSPAVSSTSMGSQLPPGAEKVGEKIADAVPLQRWHDLEHHGYIHVEVRPDEVRADWIVVSRKDAAAQPERLSSWGVDRTWPPALFEVDPGRPHRDVGADADRAGLPLDAMPPRQEPVLTPVGRRKRVVRRVAVSATAVLAAWVWQRRRRPA